MRPFAYRRAESAEAAVAAGAAGATFLAGGTDLVQLLQEGVADVDSLLDISRLPLGGVTRTEEGFAVGATTTLAELAADSGLQAEAAAVAQAVEASASRQVRNVATVGGNLLQRTRCLYFREPTAPCNKRLPGSGCPALTGRNRLNAVFGGSAACIAAHASDLAVALAALDADVTLLGAEGERRLRLEDLYRLPGDAPHLETTLRPGELVAAVRFPAAERSGYLKIRDRASFEWALVSVAATVRLDGERIASARVAAGGVGVRPWRLHPVESALMGATADGEAVARAAARAADGAAPHGENAFKLPMLIAAVERVLTELLQ
jgi:xanthine dehydrogenase YagS FAD-binding subunit